MARDMDTTARELAEVHRDKAVCMLSFVVEALRSGAEGEAEFPNLSGAPLEGLFHILEEVEAHLCEAGFPEAEHGRLSRACEVKRHKVEE
ncbi:MAG: hypothetical protein K6E40_12890 [Desulfovibrio sp.]|nr:hypothetical protein [Desulfovibrio sp.]